MDDLPQVYREGNVVSTRKDGGRVWEFIVSERKTKKRVRRGDDDDDGDDDRDDGEDVVTHRMCDNCAQVLEMQEFEPGDGAVCWRCRGWEQEHREDGGGGGDDNSNDSSDWISKKISTYKSYALKQGYPFELSDLECRILFQQRCIFCGNSAQGMGMCRLDPGVYCYRLDNVVTACHDCSFMKFNHTYETFVKICRHIASYRGGLQVNPVRFPECFANSPSKKSHKHYMNLNRRIMVLDAPAFNAVATNDCFYCGKQNVPNVHQNGIDRIDSRNRKYELGNVVACCKTCNTLKWTLAQDVFLQHVSTIALYASPQYQGGISPIQKGRTPSDPICL